MNYTTLYSGVYRARNLTHKLAKVLVWVFGLQAAILYLLASVADAPLTSLTGPALRVAVAVAFMLLVPRLFDTALQRIERASQRAE
ncbi:hypothetical protein [Pseudomonas coleopterorum]|uniref:hypothetical protein n=1 Tax=Pseudomonas coleopterorum TaxID=1605838 RepID=UPI0017805440|nr:hypothetical protein [Pseudomonas coleopterorum]MBD8483920.1 hypothetical protein [Pseudomonas coleopterorum]